LKTQILEKLETKEFTFKDMDYILEIRNELKKKGCYSFACERMFDEILQEAQRSGSLFGRVAYLNDRPVGFILGDVQPKWYLEPDSAWLICIVVHPDYRRLGIGRRLLVEFLEQVRDLKLRKVCVVSEVNDEETLCFLQKMGFKRGRFVQLEKQI